jgi:hypothetical protein
VKVKLRGPVLSMAIIGFSELEGCRTDGLLRLSLGRTVAVEAKEARVGEGRAVPGDGLLGVPVLVTAEPDERDEIFHA